MTAYEEFGHDRRVQTKKGLDKIRAGLFVGWFSDFDVFPVLAQQFLHGFDGDHCHFGWFVKVEHNCLSRFAELCLAHFLQLVTHFNQQ
jgi:hypothetical protein